jgi:hypothetical protein
MKKYFFVLAIMFSSTIYSQIDISTGMGINYFNASSLFDYINVNFSGGDRLQSFNSAAEFFLEGDYTISPKFQVGLEYAYSIYSYNKLLGVTNYDLSLNFHKPSLLAYYIIPGEGYKFKFGGGVGYRISKATERIGENVNYSANGFGLLVRAQGLTTLGDDLYVLIGVDARYDLNGEPSSNNKTMINPIDNSNVNLNVLSFCFKIGIAYIIED